MNPDVQGKGTPGSCERPNRMSRLYKYYVALLLLVVYMVNQTDRNVFGFVMEAVKRDLRLSDTQLGFAGGPALVLLYSVLGVPIARWGDRSHRVNIMSTAIVAWSCATVFFAAVRSFWQLTFAQIGLGIGEAGFSAVAVALIGDYHSDEVERGRAVALFMLAIPLSGIAGSLMAGWINEIYGWRTVFIAAGLLGFPLAVLMKWTVREPQRRGASDNLAVERDTPSLASVLKVLWRRRALRHLAVGQCLANVTVNCGVWLFPFFLRKYPIGTGALGNWFAVIYGIGGIGGTWLSGYLPSLSTSQNGSARARFAACTIALVSPMLMIVMWCPARNLSLLMLIPCQALMSSYMAPTMTLVQTLAPAKMRATTASVFILLQMLAGGVVGSQLVGSVSDLMTPLLGSSASALRSSIALFSLTGLWAAVHFWRAGHFAQQELADPVTSEIDALRGA